MGVKISKKDEISFEDRDKEDFIGLLRLVLGELENGTHALSWFAATSSMGGKTEVTFRIDEKVQNGTKVAPEGV